MAAFCTDDVFASGYAVWFARGAATREQDVGSCGRGVGVAVLVGGLVTDFPESRVWEPVDIPVCEMGEHRDFW